MKLPGLSRFTDRHGRERWYVRVADKKIYLKAPPDSDEFQLEYIAAINGTTGEAQAETTFFHAWKLLKSTAAWQSYSSATMAKNRFLIEEWLRLPIGENTSPSWGNAKLCDFKRRHVMQLLGIYKDTPHKAKHLLTAIRKLIQIGLDHEWIELDPTHKIKWRPAYQGWRAWTVDEMRRFLNKWPAGSTPRLIFLLGLTLGPRRQTLATLKWSERTKIHMRRGESMQEVIGWQMHYAKTSRSIFVPEMPALSEELKGRRVQGDYVVMTQYGKPFSEKSLTGRMADWSKAAGNPKGCTIHGLRKTLGKHAAEGGATTRQIMEILGHDDIQHAELYSREAEQARLAKDGSDKAWDSLSSIIEFYKDD